MNLAHVLFLITIVLT